MREARSFPVVLLSFFLTAFLCAAVIPVAHAARFESACGRTGWYFAEGYTGGDFDTWILLQNPNQTDAVAHLRFFTPYKEPVCMDLSLGGETRTSVYLNGLPQLQGEEVAAEVTCEGEGVVAERAMYFKYQAEGVSRAGGHASIGAPSPSTSWYLPEGYTGGSFDTYLLLMNPGEEDAWDVHVKILTPRDGKYYMFSTSVPAGRRKTIRVDDLVWKEGADNVIASATPEGTVKKAFYPGEGGGEVRFDDTELSLVVFSDRPLVAERAMYFDYYGRAGGSCSMGATGTAATWYLPEGYTGGDFDTWVLAMNPSGYTVDITYTFFTDQPGSEPVSVTHHCLPPWSRDTICVNQVPGLEGKDVATMVSAVKSEDGTPAGIVAEHSLYFRYLSTADGNASLGSPSLYPEWFLAEGYTGGAFDTYVLVMNPLDVAQLVTATFMTPQGAVVEREYELPPRYRLTIKVDDVDPSLASADVSTRLTSRTAETLAAGIGPGIVAERAMYFLYRDPGDGSTKAGGSCSIGYGSW